MRTGLNATGIGSVRPHTNINLGNGNPVRSPLERRALCQPQYRMLTNRVGARMWAGYVCRQAAIVDYPPPRRGLRLEGTEGFAGAEECRDEVYRERFHESLEWCRFNQG